MYPAEAVVDFITPIIFMVCDPILSTRYAFKVFSLRMQLALG